MDRKRYEKGGKIMQGAGIVSKKSVIRVTMIFLSIMFVQLPICAVAENWAATEDLTVMTRNLYLGAEIQSIAGATEIPDFIGRVTDALLQIAETNYLARAEALAAEIIDNNSHLVGLQEVYNFTLDGNNDVPPFRNYLDDLLAALEAQGAFYNIAAIVINFNTPSIPIPFFEGVVQITDHDVILARDDVETEVVNLNGYCSPSKLSEDGCNYAVVAGADTPVGRIDFERGFVCIDAIIGDRSVRFCNTHLEVRYPDPGPPIPNPSQAVQAAQATELITILNALPKPHDTLVLVSGDINSSPEDSVDFPGIVPPYMQLLEAGYFDVWKFRRKLRHRNSKGLTCCQVENLRNQSSILYERIDVIFSSKFPKRVKAYVVGDDEEARRFLGLWPSDHAGVVARMQFRSHFHWPWWHYYHWFSKGFDH
jgi:hypothetical protein